MKFKKILLVLVVFLAAFLRFYKLGQVPASLEWDEVAIGYDAYSILKTGRDQFGQFLPITFRSLDDYKPPLYEYLAIPPIAIFGLNAFATRFPSAFFGTLSILLSYFLVKELFEKSKQKEAIALFTAFLFAISPWHLQFSRAAFEVNLSVFVVLASLWSFLKALKNSKYFYLTALFFGLGLFSYHSTRVVLPLLMLFLSFVFRKKLPKQQQLLGPTALLLIFLLPFLMIAFSSNTQMRLKVTGINNMFNSLDVRQATEKNLAVDRVQAGDFNFRFFHGRKVTLIKTLIDNYSSHFNPGFLFVYADMPLHHAPGFGLLYRFEIPFLLTGFIVFFKKYFSKKTAVLPWWFFIAPLPAAVTLQVPHAVRAELFLPTFQIFTAIGLVEAFMWIKKSWRKLLVPLVVLAAVFLVYDFSNYLHQYYVHLNYEVAKDWLYGREQAVAYTESVKDRYNKIVVSPSLEMSHMFWLFYSQHDPKKYLQQGGTVSGSFTEQNNRFDKYAFHLIDKDKWRDEKDVLFVALPSELPMVPKPDPLKTIYYPNGEPGIVIWENK